MKEDWLAGGYYPEEYNRAFWERKSGWLAQHIINKDNPKTFYDIGAGFGFLIDDMIAHGVDATGLEFDMYAYSNASPLARHCMTLGRIEDLGKVHELRQQDVVFCTAIPYIHPIYLHDTLKYILLRTNKAFYMPTFYRGQPITHVDHNRRIQLSEQEWADLIKFINPNFHYTSQWRYERCS